MRLKLLAITLVILIIGFAGIHKMNEAEVGNGLTEVDVQEVYNNLVQYTGMAGQIPPLFVLRDPQINAWISPIGLVITTGILRYVKDKNELAAIIGHEMGHFVLGHLRGELKDDSRIHEANCDKFGIYLLLRAGYDPCGAYDLWSRMGHTFGDDIGTVSHPSPSQRSYSLDLPICHVIFQ